MFNTCDMSRLWIVLHTGHRDVHKRPQVKTHCTQLPRTLQKTQYYTDVEIPPLDSYSLQGCSLQNALMGKCFPTRGMGSLGSTQAHSRGYYEIVLGQKKAGVSVFDNYFPRESGLK